MLETKRIIEYIVIDVDGTLTDAGIYYDEHGNELKKFCTKDAAGFFAAKNVGIMTMILTGRECAATLRRMQELKVDYVVQNVKDKVSYLRTFMAEHNICREQIAYIGDDLNDLPPMQLVGYVACPADSCKEILAIADYVSPVKGGSGAVRDVVEHILIESGEWQSAINNVYGIGI